MEGFVALAVFAEQMSKQQGKLCSTQHRRDQQSSNRHDEALLPIQNLALAASDCQVEVKCDPMPMEPRLLDCPAFED
jgi:hypothetical protein